MRELITKDNRNTMNQKEVIQLINDYWKFDNDQDNLSTWHDKQDLISEIEKLNLSGVSQWVAVSDRKPPEEWSNYIVCLENEAVFTANYCRIVSERWFIVGVGEITNENPVIYWMEEPKPPCG